MQLFLRHGLNAVLSESVNVENGFANTDCGHIKLHTDVGCRTKVACVENTIAIDQEQLREHLWSVLAEALEKDCIHGNLLESKEARDVRVICLLFLEVLIDHLHAGERKDDDGGDGFLLVVFGIADINGAYTRKCSVSWVVSVKGPIEPVCLLQLLLQSILLFLPLSTDILIYLFLQLCELVAFEVRVPLSFFFLLFWLLLLLLGLWSILCWVLNRRRNGPALAHFLRISIHECKPCESMWVSIRIGTSILTTQGLEMI